MFWGREKKVFTVTEAKLKIQGIMTGCVQEPSNSKDDVMKTMMIHAAKVVMSDISQGGWIMIETFIAWSDILQVNHILYLFHSHNNQGINSLDG